MLSSSLQLFDEESSVAHAHIPISIEHALHANTRVSRTVSDPGRDSIMNFDGRVTSNDFQSICDFQAIKYDDDDGPDE